jgi:hypothetical protein
VGVRGHERRSFADGHVFAAVSGRAVLAGRGCACALLELTSSREQAGSSSHVLAAVHLPEPPPPRRGNGGGVAGGAGFASPQWLTLSTGSQSSKPSLQQYSSASNALPATQRRAAARTGRWRRRRDVPLLLERRGNRSPHSRWCRRRRPRRPRHRSSIRCSGSEPGCDGTRRRRPRLPGMPCDRDHVRAVLTADLEDLAADAFVPDRVPGLATVAEKLHAGIAFQRTSSETGRRKTLNLGRRDTGCNCAEKNSGGKGVAP